MWKTVKDKNARNKNQLNPLIVSRYTYTGEESNGLIKLLPAVFPTRCAETTDRIRTALWIYGKGESAAANVRPTTSIGRLLYIYIYIK